MSQKLINAYVLLCGLGAITMTILEIQPALLFINILAPNPGDRYNLVLVLLITFLILILPLLGYLILSHLLRSKTGQHIPTNQTGIIISRQKSLTSALISIPIFLNEQKIDAVDNGKTLFIEIPKRKHIIQAGIGKQASEKIEIHLSEKEQVTINLHINVEGLFPKFVLNNIRQ